MRRLAIAAFVMASSGCGGETAVLVDVTLEGLQVPGDVNTLHFRLFEDSTLHRERTFPLADGDTAASLALQPNDATPDSLTLIVLGLRNQTVVAQSNAVGIEFIDGEVSSVAAPVCAPRCP